jgi:hypothetical protein
MDQAELHAVAVQVHRNGPLGITVAIAAHNGYGRSKILNRLQNGWRADIAQVPDFIGAGCERFEVGRQLVVGISENEYLQIGGHFVLFRCVRPNNA